MSRGVIFLALGDPYYGTWAFNAAAGIKYTNPETKISIAYKGAALQFIEPNKSIFDQIIEIPDECINRNGFESFLRAKVCLYDLSPYDETIFIDADVIWYYNKDINNLWEEVNKTDFTIGCRGNNNLNEDPRLLWCKPQDLLNKFGNKNLYNLSSEFIYFKKTQKVKEFFKLAQQYFDHPEVDYNLFGGTVPDELAFQIAMMHSDIKPHKDKWLPFYWEPYHKQNLNQSNIYDKEWFGYSIGGNQITATQKHIYDSLADLYGKAFGVKFTFKSYSKKDVLKFREKI